MRPADGCQVNAGGVCASGTVARPTGGMGVTHKTVRHAVLPPEQSYKISRARGASSPFQLEPHTSTDMCSASSRAPVLPIALFNTHIQHIVVELLLNLDLQDGVQPRLRRQM